MVDSLIQFWMGLLEVTILLGSLMFAILIIFILADFRDAYKAQEPDKARRHDDVV